MEKSVAGESRQHRASRALEESVMKFVMPVLDAMLPNGQVDLNAVPGSMPATVVLDGLFAKEMCKEVGALIKARFATPPDTCEEKYFTFPSQPDFVSQEYGGLEDGPRGDNYEQVFEDLMKLLRESEGPLGESDLNYLKDELMKDPNLLGLLSRDPEPGVDKMYGDLCSLLHLAAAGPAHDADLVDWMIQMGALIIQPTLHCRQEPLLKEMEVPRWMYPNTMAVHNAVIAGYEDIVQVILGADNFVDVNTPTFHTKETLAHLAVKNGHKDLFKTLQAFGADLRIKDANGRSLSDVAADRKWAREIARRTAEYFAKIPGDARRSDSIMPPQIIPRTVRRARQSASESSSTTTARGKTNKKKGKKGKKGGPKEESLIATAALAPETAIDTKRVLMRLLQAVGFDIDESMEWESVTVLEEKLRKLTTGIFTRLRDPSISADDKTDDVHNACELIKDTEGLVASYSKPSSLNSTLFHVRVAISSEAVYCIHMMQKLNRVDHAAITVPSIDPVLELCDTSSSYADLVVGTAKLCVSVNRKPQAREILDVLEKRLLKIPFDEREPSEYRELVQAYSNARDSMGLWQASNPKAFDRLEWYLTNTLGFYEMELKLDGMAGRPFYFECTLAAEASELEFARFGISIISKMPEVVVLNHSDRRAIYGGMSKADVANISKRVVMMTEKHGISLDDEKLQLCTTSIHLDGFVFSNSGILRKASTA